MYEGKIVIVMNHISMRTRRDIPNVCASGDYKQLFIPCSQVPCFELTKKTFLTFTSHGCVGLNVGQFTCILFTMEKLQMILRIWTKLSTSVRVRDRLCKVTQYSCQMLLGFYVAKMTKETTDMLSLTKYTCSTSRKAFWMFKSLNHLQLMVDMLDCQKLTFKNKDLGLYLIEVFEQFYFILYHWWEAAVFLARCKILDPSQEAAVGRHTNNAWFISDLLGWLATFIKLVRQVNTIYKKYRKLSREQMARVDTGSTMPSTTMVSSPEGETR